MLSIRTYNNNNNNTNNNNNNNNNNKTLFSKGYIIMLNKLFYIIAFQTTHSHQLCIT